VLGWTAASPVSGRRVYAGVIEHSLYVDPGCHGVACHHGRWRDVLLIERRSKVAGAG
jgi:L-amino acid N-acyltransferase YncA